MTGMKSDDVAGSLKWADLTSEKKCVLYNAATSSLLQDVLLDWEPESSASELVSQIPRLASAVVDLTSAGLVEVYLYRDFPNDDGDFILGDEMRSTVENTAAWNLESDREILVELISTSWAEEVLRSRGSEDLYSYRNHSS